MFLRRGGRGDTIIEVLLCIAIAGLAITGAYALSSHSLQEGISAAERTEANKLAESQIEALKLREKTGGSTWATNFQILPASFCLDTSQISDTILTAGVPVTNPAWLPQPNSGPDRTNLTTNVAQASHYNTVCTAAESNSTTPKYFIDVASHADPTYGTAYLVTIRWIPPGHGPLNTSHLYYKLPPVL